MERGEHGVFGECNLTSTSMFTPNILNDDTNQFKRYVTIDAASGFTDTVQDYWRTENADLIGTDTNFQSNIQPIQKIFLTTVNANKSNLEVVGKFLTYFLMQTRAFRIYLGPYTVGKEGEPVYTTYPNDTQPAWVGWTIDDQGNEYLEGYLAEAGPTPGNFNNPLQWWELSAKLMRNQTVTCTLVPLARLNGDFVVLAFTVVKKIFCMDCILV